MIPNWHPDHKMSQMQGIPKLSTLFKTRSKTQVSSADGMMVVEKRYPYLTSTWLIFINWNVRLDAAGVSKMTVPLFLSNVRWGIVCESPGLWKASDTLEVSDHGQQAHDQGTAWSISNPIHRFGNWEASYPGLRVLYNGWAHPSRGVPSAIFEANTPTILYRFMM